MKPYFNVDSDYDVILLPYSPVYERDELEIRVQVYNAGGGGEVTVEFYMDENCLGSESLDVAGGSYGFARKYLQIQGLAGGHRICLRFYCAEGEMTKDFVSIPLTILGNPKVMLDGGFVMIGPPNDREACKPFCKDLKSFSEDDWRRYITEMHKIGQDCIIVMCAHQYLTLAGRELVAHYDSKLYPKSDVAAGDPIAAILSEAGKNGQTVFLGVGNCYGYEGTQSDMEELFERYRAYKAFYGWYLALELPMNVDTRSGTETDIQRWKHYDYLFETAYRLSPVKPVMVSPYEMPNDLFAEYMKKDTCIDIVMPQDWAGQCMFTIEQSAEMHRRLYPICKETHKHFWANCESFNFSEPNCKGYLVPRFRGGGMVGEKGFDKQMAAVRPYVEKIMNFMLTGFFTPVGFEPICGGAASVKQYKDYIKYLEEDMIL